MFVELVDWWNFVHIAHTLPAWYVSILKWFQVATYEYTVLKVVKVCANWNSLLFTARVRSTTEGYVFTDFCPLTRGWGNPMVSGPWSFAGDAGTTGLWSLVLSCGEPPRQACSWSWWYPWTGQGVTPPPSGQAMPRAVRLLRSCWRTFCAYFFFVQLHEICIIIVVMTYIT